jgi:hypothetical protein
MLISGRPLYDLRIVVSYFGEIDGDILLKYLGKYLRDALDAVGELLPYGEFILKINEDK